MQYKFIDLFAGIGGFHLALHKLNQKCVFASELDKHARNTYELNFKKKSSYIFENKLFNQDILLQDYSKIPNFDILCAGFPCQPFSQIGKRKGFQESVENRGNMFFSIVDIIKAKKPKVLILENVKNLLNHDKGNTFFTIRKIIEEKLKYSFHYKIIKACDFGLPQLRPRLFMVCFRDEQSLFSKFTFPKPITLNKSMSDIFKGKCDREIGFTLRVGGTNSPYNDRRNWDNYSVDGKIVRLNVDQAKEMMGFPKSFKFQVSSTQAMKQLGNSVAVNVVHHLAKNVISHLNYLSNLN